MPDSLAGRDALLDGHPGAANEVGQGLALLADLLADPGIYHTALLLVTNGSSTILLALDG